MAVQAAAFTPLRDNGEVWLCHVAHEQQNVDMPSLPAKRPLVITSALVYDHFKFQIPYCSFMKLSGGVCPLFLFFV